MHTPVDLVKAYERVDDLQRNGLQIIQNPEWFSFGIDAVLLSAFAQAKAGSKVVDLCTGNGIIPLLMHAKCAAKSIVGIEIQAEVAEMASRSVQLNQLTEHISIINADVLKLDEIIDKTSVDVITCNPPYFKAAGGIHNDHAVKTLSRHEVALSLEGLFQSVFRLLKPQGHFYMVHRADRLVDILYWARTFKIEPKTIRFVHPKAKAKPNLVLLKCVKYGGHELRFETPLVVYNEAGSFTQEIFDIYACAQLTAFEAHDKR